MPLLNRKAYEFLPKTPALDVAPDQEVWVVKATDEVCSSYETYLEKVALYEQPVWSCKYTSKGGLRLEEALASERKALAALAAFPKELEEQVLRGVHHSLLRLDELVNSVYDGLRPAAPEGAANADAGPAAAGAQQESPSPFGSKENEPQQGGPAAEVPPAAEKPAAPAGNDAAESGADAAAAGAQLEPATALKAGAAAGGEGAKSGKKPKTPKAPVSKSLLRTYIIENAEQQGPERATRLAWVVAPALRRQYGLPDELPADVAEKVAASVKAPRKTLEAPKGLGGTTLPAKKGKKAAAGGDATGESAGGAGSSEAKPPKEKAPMVSVAAKPLEEVEGQYKEGTLKHLLVAVLKAVQPEPLTAQGIVDKAKELGLKDLEEKERNRIPNVLASDPNFLRISKGAYSLHCFHPEREQLVKAPQPKQPKEGKPSKKAAAAASTPGGGGAADGAPSTGKKARDSRPMLRVEAKALEEVEKQYKEGTLKHMLVAILKAVQPEPLTTQSIVDKGKELGVEGIEEKAKAIPNALATDPNFIRLGKGAYSLHCFHPEREQLVKAPKPKDAKQPKEGPGGTPAAADAAEQQGAKEEVPRVRVEAKPWEEVEKQYKEGTTKHAVAAALKAVQPEPLSLQGIVEKAKELGLVDLTEKHKTVAQALAADPNFIRLGKGAYSLHCFHPEREQWVREKKRKFAPDGEEGASKRHEGSAAPQAGEEVDSVTRAEQQVRQTQRALVLHRSALEKAQAVHDEAKAAYAAERKKVKTPSKERRASDIHIPAELLARFDVPEEEREFQGAADDRKGLLEHRQKLQARIKELEKAKKEFVEEERRKQDAAAKEGTKEAKAAELALRRAERALEQERRAVESAEKAAAAAEKRLEKEKDKAARGEEKAKEREEREKQKQVEREERERRRAEAAKAKEEARRYPMEDLELLAELQQKAVEDGAPLPSEDVYQPRWMSGEDSQRLSTALYVADVVSQFAKQLGCKAVSYEHLQAALADATSGGGGEGDHTAATLHSVYEALLRTVLDDLRDEDEASAQEKRWAAVLGEGTWPEVLRRFVLTRAGEEAPYLHPTRPAVMAASMLAHDPLDRLTHDQHLALLRCLCDAALDSEKMRGVLQRREDEAVDVKRDVREELAEQRKQLKEILDAEKDERKRRREEQKRAEEEEKAAAEAAAAAAAAQGSQQDAPKPSGKQSRGGTPMVVDEPSFELPERLREFRGASDDKKGLLQWRQEQAAERRRLEKERNKWVAEQLRRQREQEAAEKAAREAEKAKQREKEEKEEAIVRAQEELEERLEKYSVRRAPLGLDRRHRRYWWGLAGHRPAVYVEDQEGRWGSFASLADLDAHLASLDRRGVRELALAEALEKRFQSISIAMQRAERAAAAAAAAAPGDRRQDRLEPPRRSGREKHQVEFFDPVKGGSKAGASSSAAAAAAAATGLEALMGRAECAAVAAAVEGMLELQEDASGLLDAPDGCASWKEWAAAVRAVAQGEATDGGAAASAASLRQELASRLAQLEAALLAESRGGLAADGDGDESEGEAVEGSGEASGGGTPAEGAELVLDVVDEVFSPSRRPDVAYLWKTQRERSAWQADMRQAATAARLAYCAAVLAQQAAPMLSTLRKAAEKSSKKGKGKGSGGKAAAAAEARASSKAPAAGSRPISRTTSAAQLDAGSGKASAKGGKRKAAAPPENMRLTRSRH